jgi:hypothetical protein
MSRVTPSNKPSSHRSPSTKLVSVADRSDKKTIGDILQSMPAMIAAVVKQVMSSIPAPVVNVEAPKTPEVRVSSPVYVDPPQIRIPATVVNVPDGKAPVVNVEPPEVHLTLRRPTKWKFTHNRDEYGRITTTIAEDIS